MGGYNQHTQYPKGVWYTSDLTNAEQIVMDDKPIRIDGVAIRTVTAAVVSFTSTEGTPKIYFKSTLAANTSTFIPVRAEFANGLRLITAASSGDTEVTVFYYAPSETYTDNT